MNNTLVWYPNKFSIIYQYHIIVFIVSLRTVYLAFEVSYPSLSQTIFSIILTPLTGNTRTRKDRVDVASAASPANGAGRRPTAMSFEEAMTTPVRRKPGRPAKRRRGAPRGNRNARGGRGRRTTVVNLDGASSSESEGEKEWKENQKKPKEVTEVESKEHQHITLRLVVWCDSFPRAVEIRFTSLYIFLYSLLTVTISLFCFCFYFFSTYQECCLGPSIYFF